MIDVVIDNADSDFLRFASIGKCIDFPVVAETQCAVAGAAEKPHWMFLEGGQGCCVLSVIHCGLVDVEGASVALAEEYHPAFRGVYRVAVLAGIECNLGVASIGCVIIENVAGH